MKKCTNCGRIQEAGNFCGQCGSSLSGIEDVTQQISVANQDNQLAYEQQSQTSNSVKTNEQIDKFKKESSQYLSYFIEQMKQPSKNFFNTVAQFKQNVISVGFYLVLFSLVIYMFLSKVGYESDLWYAQLPSKTSIILKIDLFVLLTMFFGVLSVFITIKFFGSETSIKTIVSQCASYLVIPIVALIISIFAILMESVSIAVMFLVISLLLVMLVIPTFVVLMLLSKHSKSIDCFYAYLIFLVITIVLNVVFNTVLIRSTISNISGSIF